MIHVGASDAGEVETLFAGLLERREVGVVGHAAVDLVAHRVRRRVGVGLPQCLDHPAVVLARLEHQRRAAAAPHFDRDDQRHVVEPGMPIHKCARAQEAQFLGVGKQHDQVVAQLAALSKGSERLEDRRDARAVVARAQRDFAAVVVRRHEHRSSAGLRPRNPRQHIVDGRGSGVVRRRQERRGGLNAGLVAEAAQLLKQVVAHVGVGGRPGGPRLRGNLHEVRHGARRREDGIRGAGRHGRGH